MTTKQMLIIAAVIGTPIGLWLIFAIIIFDVLTKKALKGFEFVIRHAMGGH